MAERIGQRLGNYNLLQLLGEGGFAEVYLGEHQYLKSQAAIKVLQTRLSGSADTDSFLKEAQTIARLSHPNIVRVMDFGIEGETPYLVMDYAPSGTLRNRHPHGTVVPLETIVPYVKQVADALQYAHDEHIVHRDIKPENMLVGKRNEILLSDFGIALVAQSSRYQGTQDVIGTVAYMSPEQIQGKPRPASDQYSLAVVAYEWLTGTRPFHGSFTEICTQHMFAPPPPMREKLTQISPEVERVIMKALDKDPRQRFEHIKDFAAALEQATQPGQSFKTEQMQPTGTNYNTALMQTDNTTSPIQPAAGTPAPYTMLQSQPYGSQTNAPNNTQASTGLPGSQGSIPPQPGHNFPGNPNNPSENNLSTPNPYSATTAAQTNFDPRNKQAGRAQQPPQTPQVDGQFGQQKLVLPSHTPPAGGYNQNQGGYNNNQPQGPQNYAPARPPQPIQPPQLNPNLQRQYPQQQQQQQQPYGGYNNPGNQQQQSPYQQGPQNRPHPNQYEQQQHMQQQQQPPVRPTPRPAPPEQDEEDYGRRSDYGSSRAAERHDHQEPQESLADWLGPLNGLKWPILATIAGVILFCALNSFRPDIYGQKIPVVLVVPLFFGGAFGLLPGLIVGVVGELLSSAFYPGNNTLTATLFHGGAFYNYHTWWFPLAFYGIAGLATGLSRLRPRKFPSIGSSIRATILAIIVLAIEVGYVLYNTRLLRIFPTVGLDVLANIVICFIALIVYSIVGRLIDPA
ncbi:serine/threonine-protein kinase [Dictyobacter arantiisoli]|uniref:non-specific serine/threonine protein kinase n=1 Tax=Dictyobacter arantiisoli TaxID=2014874 RepID=A0A5A5TJI0_9CHLR|nr:serine/threonine-protein kinase [Dictyobacter arantiisoli]GCF11502.1 hypothetical protein KDI_50660 [Dictyobacter arantiisoli]